MTDEQRLQIITEQLILVRDNLFRGMSKSIQKLQARSINELLELPNHTQSPPAQQEPVAAECNFVGTKEWGRCSIEHHNLVQSGPHKWPGYQTRLLYTSHQPAQQQEPVRIYDYVWPQREEHKDECIYACSYTPAQHLERGELLAVVHPSQLISTYLQREGETAENPLYTSPQPAQRTWVGLTDEQCDALMLALNEWARDVDQYEYGLPFYDEELRAQAREIIRTAHGIKENT